MINMINIKQIAFFVGLIPWGILYRSLCNNLNVVANDHVAIALLAFQWAGVLTLMYYSIFKRKSHD